MDNLLNRLLVICVVIFIILYSHTQIYELYLSNVLCYQIMSIVLYKLAYL